MNTSNPRFLFAKNTWVSRLSLIGLCAGWGLTCTAAETPPAPAPLSFRAMTFNIHHGEGGDGKVDLQRIADLVRQERVDMVALQEVDKGVRRTQQRDFPLELANRTGLTCVFSNNFSFQGGEYGNAVLSRFPVLGWTNTHYRMLRTNEQRGVLQVKVQVGQRPIVFVSTHTDYHPDDAERLQNADQLLEILAGYRDVPVIIGGDFNDVPTSRIHGKLKDRLQDVWEKAGTNAGFTIPSSRPIKRIDYLWITPNAPWTPQRAWVPATDASDHLPVVAEFVSQD
jgi:endonuclease/exonuclease/phosphatase family metal-dependent hydrolase